MDPSSARLQGWKEIADTLGVTVRTAQRWEHDADLPVHRILRSRKAPVFAIRSDIGAWQTRLAAVGPVRDEPRPAAVTPRRQLHHPGPDDRRRSPIARGWRYVARLAVGLFLVSR